jgi:isopenicillin-N N-acyltransferase-like protein
LRVHRSAERDPGARGRALGLAHGDAVAANVAFYERLIPGLASYASSVELGKELVAEIEGMASGAGVSVESLLAMQARTELLGGSECSLIGRPGRVEQNWDWYPEVVPLVWVVEQGRGRWFCTLTEAGMIGKIGVSSAGLCFGLNLLHCSLDGGLRGVPVHVLLRTLLGSAESFDDAVAVLRVATVSASSCITVGSADDVVAVELSPGGASVVRRDPLLHTNHFLAGPPAGEDVEVTADTLGRLDALTRGEPLSSTRQDEPDATTLATVVMEPGRMVVNGEEIALP